MEKNNRSDVFNLTSQLQDISSNSTTRNYCLTHLLPSNVDIKFYLVVFGSSIAPISVLENMFLVFLIATRPAFRSSALFYIGILGIFDTILSISYVVLLLVPLLYDTFMYYWIWRLWNAYALYLFTLVYVILTASEYLIFCGTLEEYLGTLKKHRFQVLKRVLQLIRPWLALGTILIGLTIQVSQIWEWEVMWGWGCPGMESMLMMSKSLTGSSFWDRVITFYFRNIFDVFIPFLLLLYMNIVIVLSWRRKQRREIFRQLPDLVLNRHVTAHVHNPASRVLISYVLEYLISEVLLVILTTWETFDRKGIWLYRDFYYYAVDICSTLTVIFRALRLPIYCFCHPEIRDETVRTVKNLYNSCTCKKNTTLQRTRPVKTRRSKSGPSEMNMENEDEGESNPLTGMATIYMFEISV